jgi:hypothetical protein
VEAGEAVLGRGSLRRELFAASPARFRLPARDPAAAARTRRDAVLLEAVAHEVRAAADFPGDLDSRFLLRDVLIAQPCRVGELRISL